MERVLELTSATGISIRQNWCTIRSCPYKLIAITRLWTWMIEILSFRSFFFFITVIMKTIDSRMSTADYGGLKLGQSREIWIHQIRQGMEPR